MITDDMALIHPYRLLFYICGICLSVDQHVNAVKISSGNGAAHIELAGEFRNKLQIYVDNEVHLTERRVMDVAIKEIFCPGNGPYITTNNTAVMMHDLPNHRRYWTLFLKPTYYNLERLYMGMPLTCIAVVNHTTTHAMKFMIKYPTTNKQDAVVPFGDELGAAEIISDLMSDSLITDTILVVEIIIGLAIVIGPLIVLILNYKRVYV